MLLENMPYPQDVRVRAEAQLLQSRGYRVTVLAPHATRQRFREVVEGVAVYRFKLPKTSASVAGFVAEYAMAHVQLFFGCLCFTLKGVDVVHLHNPPDTLFLVTLPAKLAGCKVVFDNHDLAPELFACKFGDTRLVKIMRHMQSTSMRWADVVITTNESQRKVAVSARHNDAGKVFVVRNGPRSKLSSDGVSTRAGILRDPHLVFLGTLATQDGVLALAGLLSTLHFHYGLDGTTMTIVGDGPCRMELERRFSEVGLTRYVDFRGWIDHRDVPQALESADICIDPAPCNALNHQSTMIKIAEYLAAAKPTVAYDLVETQRTAGDAALLAPCGQPDEMAAHVARLARDQDLRRRLTSRAFERSETLMWYHAAEELAAAYAGLA